MYHTLVVQAAVFFSECHAQLFALFFSCDNSSPCVTTKTQPVTINISNAITCITDNNNYKNCHYCTVYACMDRVVHGAGQARTDQKKN